MKHEFEQKNYGGSPEMKTKYKFKFYVWGSPSATCFAETIASSEEEAFLHIMARFKKREDFKGAVNSFSRKENFRIIKEELKQQPDTSPKKQSFWWQDY